MFRKLVSNLAFSPTLIGQLGFYAKRLRKEEATRRVGLVFTALALVVQSFAVFSPPESANAANPSNFVSGGVSSLSDFLAHYDRNTNGIRDLYDSIGLTRGEVESTRAQSINSKSKYMLSWGLTSRFGAAQGEGSYSAGGRTFYYRPLRLWDTLPYTQQHGSTYTMFVGHSAKLGWFAIMKNCANLVTEVIPQPTPAPQPVPQPSASCTRLSITQVGTHDYKFSSTGAIENNVNVYAHIYQIYRDGTFIGKQQVDTDKLSTEYTYHQEQPGTYKVEFVIRTSMGERSNPDCVGSFTVAAPTPPPPPVKVEVCEYDKSLPKDSPDCQPPKAPEVCPYNKDLPKDSPDCQPCPGDRTLWIKDEKCAANIVQTKEAKNLTQGDVSATTVTAKESDKITYFLTVENKGLNTTTASIEERIEDVLEYASVVDNGGATFDQEAKTLTWSDIRLEPKEKQTRAFIVQVSDTIPSMPQGTSDPASYNCIMTNTFGNSIDINVNCSAPKVIVEQITTELPQTGPTENMAFAGITLAIVAYFYARSRQLGKEVRLIRRGANAGTI